MPKINCSSKVFITVTATVTETFFINCNYNCNWKKVSMPVSPLWVGWSVESAPLWSSTTFGLPAVPAMCNSKLCLVTNTLSPTHRCIRQQRASLMPLYNNNHAIIITSNVTGRHRGLKSKLWDGYRAPSLKRTSCCNYFSSSRVVSRVFSALCVYSKFGHHPHP